jgi:DNA-binding transcriptional MerR regulator
VSTARWYGTTDLPLPFESGGRLTVEAMSRSEAPAGRYRIAEVGRLTGFNPTTLRFYETAGVLAPPLRTASGYRTYGDRDVEGLRLIARAQGPGLQPGGDRRARARLGRRRVRPSEAPAPGAHAGQGQQVRRHIADRRPSRLATASHGRRLGRTTDRRTVRRPLRVHDRDDHRRGLRAELRMRDLDLGEHPLLGSRRLLAPQRHAGPHRRVASRSHPGRAAGGGAERAASRSSRTRRSPSSRGSSPPSTPAAPSSPSPSPSTGRGMALEVTTRAEGSSMLALVFGAAA